MPKSISVISDELRAEFNASSASVLARYAVEDVQHMKRSEVEHLKLLLGHGEDWGCWSTPRAWFPGGYEASWNARVQERIKYFLPQPWNQLAQAELDSQPFLRRLLDEAVLSCTRYLVLCRIGPVHLKTGRESLDPSVIAQSAYARVPLLAAASIGKVMASPPAQGRSSVDLPQRTGCFSLLTEEDIQALPCADSMKVSLLAELKRMHAVSTRGLWNDAPQIQVDISKPTKVVGDAPAVKPETTRDPHLPLPDEFVGEMGQKSYWLITHLGPNIIRVLQAFHELWKTAALTGQKARKLSERCQSLLRTQAWTDAEGKPIEALPFDVRQNRRGAHSKKGPAKGNAIDSETQDAERPTESEALDSWPPRGATQVFGLARLLQGAHLFVTGLSTGARNGEVLVMERSCVQRAPDGTAFANGRTFKLVRRHDGEQRDWPLPELAERAFEQQATLVSLMEKLCQLSNGPIQNPDTVPEGTALWFSSYDRKDSATSTALQALLRHYASALRMDPKPSGQWIRPHRLRKTLARLVALAIVEAPKLLQDVFGHKSVEMTLYYILTDKALAAEIDTIVRELRVMRCAEDVSKFVAAEKTVTSPAIVGNRDASEWPADGYGGKAAAGVRRAVAEFGTELFQRSQDWGTDSIRELAVILTLGGTTWNLVRPGVMCTKSLGQAGPCNKKRGHPDPSNCQTECGHRLEQAWLREEVDQCVAEALAHWEFEISAQQDLVAEFWAGQVRTHVNRFADLKTKWLQDSRVRSIMQSLNQSEA